MSGLESYLISLGEELGEFLMPPFRCFFLGDNVVGCSSSTGNTGNLWGYDQLKLPHEIQVK